MKKYNILLIGALVLGLASCDDKSDLGIEQVNPQMPLVNISTLEVSISHDLTAGVNLNTYVGETLPVVVIDYPVEDLPATSTIEFEMEVASDESFDDAITIPVTEGTIPTQQLEQACTTFYGVNPSTQTMYVRFAAFLVDGLQVARVGSFDTWYATNAVKVTPIDAQLAVESEYYLVVGNSSVPFKHSDEHVYLDPNFTVSFEITDNNVPATWTIVSVSGKSYGVVADTADDAMEGVLAKDGMGGVLNNPGTYVWKINMLDLTFSIEAVKDVVPGSPTGIYLRGGWSENWDALPLYEFMATNDPTVYVVPFVSIAANTEFKVATQDWSTVNCGTNGDIIQLNVPYTLVDGGDNILLDVDFSGAAVLTHLNGAYTLTLQEYPSTTAGVAVNLYLKGNMNGWSDMPEYQFVTTNYENVWQLANQTIDAGVEFKIANDAWNDPNLGYDNGEIDETVTPCVGLNDGSNTNMYLKNTFVGTLRVSHIYDIYWVQFVEE